ncbi:hypothetical protein D9758_015544 [Tetrapyrgos nigripes]|uniref:Uncharacterized protein n=1 Tax=Tetrapyrgos nigripes TaxID=182062 RepID=A0A8H5FEX9_9AGAR|nr:hypothetical protein D9758_015544 [Tetrapyrgos nigripes]
MFGMSGVFPMVIECDYSLWIGDEGVDFISSDHPRADCMLGPLSNSCFVSACLEMRGDEKKVFEVDYFSPEDSRSEGVATTVGSDLDVWVPFVLGSYDQEEEDDRNTCVTVPYSDLLVLKYTKREKWWMLSLNSLSDSDLDCDSETERRVKREEKGTEQGGPATCYIAVGCQQQMPWTHVTFNGKGTDDVRHNLVKDEHLYDQTSATDTFKHKKLRVWIAPATELNQAFHKLHFEWVEDEDDAEDEKGMRRREGRAGE